jgi:hypothetical protein
MLPVCDSSPGRNSHMWPTRVRQQMCFTKTGSVHSVVLGTRRIRCSYGCATKIIAVYHQTTAVPSGPISREFVKLIHPSIDRVLLRAHARDCGFLVYDREEWRSTAWTRLSRQQYYRLIETFRLTALSQPAFWQIEGHWRLEVKDIGVET